MMSKLMKMEDVRGKMDQETRWLTRYNEVKTFIEENHRNPSKHRGPGGQILLQRDDH